MNTLSLIDAISLGTFNSPPLSAQCMSNDSELILGRELEGERSITLKLKDFSSITFLYTDPDEDYAILRGLVSAIAYQFAPGSTDIREIGETSNLPRKLRNTYLKHFSKNGFSSLPCFKPAVPTVKATDVLRDLTLLLHSMLVDKMDNNAPEFDDVPYSIRVVHADDEKIEDGFYEIASMSAGGVNGRQGFIYVADKTAVACPGVVISRDAEGAWAFQFNDVVTRFKPFSLSHAEVAVFSYLYESR